MTTASDVAWVDYFMSCVRNDAAVSFFLDTTPPAVARAIMAHHPRKEMLSIDDIVRKSRQMFETVIAKIASLESSRGADPYAFLHGIRHEVLFPEFIEAMPSHLKEAYEYRVDYISEFIAGNSLLDVGCGTGAFLEYVRSKRPELRLFGIDPYIQLSGGETDFSNVDLTQPGAVSPFRADTALLFHVLHHMGNRDELLIGFLERMAASCNERLLVIEDTFLDEDARADVLKSEFGFRGAESADAFIALSAETQRAVLSLVDVVVNVGMFGLQHMPFPFLYKSPRAWTALFHQAGWRTVETRPIKTFDPEYFFHGSYVFFVLEKA